MADYFPPNLVNLPTFLAKQLAKPKTYDGPGFRTPSWARFEEDSSDDEEMEVNHDDAERRRGGDNVVRNVTEFQFEESLPPLSELVGQYDLIFFSHPYCHMHGLPAQHRIIGGNMECTLASSATSHAQSLNVAIEMSTDTKKKRPWILSSIRADVISVKIEQNGNASFGNPNHEQDIGSPVLNGKLRILSEANAVRYMPESRSDIAGRPTRGEREYAESIQFETINDARTLLRQYRDAGSGPLQWLSNHMNIPIPISALVQQYATFRPPPAFIFERGDLVLSFTIDDDYDDTIIPTIIARRRHSG